MTPGQIGRYQILDLLGQGSMSTVYRARDPALERDVVVKVVTISSPTTSSDEWRHRFKREVQAAGRLNHTHIVTVYDVSLDHQPPYVVMELLSGGTLRERLQQGSLPWQQALSLFQPLIQALAYAHRAGVIHRDIKPGNIMFAGQKDKPGSQTPFLEVLKLVDFGLARQQDDSLQLTEAGTVFGTPAYLSPEQARGQVVDARADIFSMGIILFETITGYNPLNRGSLYATLAETTSPSPVDLSTLANKAPLSVMHLIERAVAKDRERRYSTCEAFLSDLTYCLGDTQDSDFSQTESGTSGQFSTRFLAKPPTSGPVISKAQGIELNAQVEGVLQAMFNQYSRLAVESEFGQGLSGGHVYRVRPIAASGKAHLPAVVKIAPVNLVRQEWQAYQTWVVNTLPGVARLESAPTLPPGSLWDGLQYTLVGGGAFEVQSLSGYYHQAGPDDLQWILTERLYQMTGVHWWLERHLDRAFQMQIDYDSILPVNLLLKPVDSAQVSNAYPITPEQLPESLLVRGDTVHLAGFVVTEIDAEQEEITLNVPASAQGRPVASYRLRVVEVPEINHYQIGQVVDALTGEVTATRHDLLAVSIHQIFDWQFDLSVERLVPPSPQQGEDPLSLPNPLLAYQDVLHDFMTVYISTIHGDLNFENILIDPDTRHLNLIDFATVRRGHSLHDLLRLETEVVTKLIPPTLNETGLPPTTIHTIYQQLDVVARHPDTAFDDMPPALEKSLAMLVAIRKMARTCLFNPEDWTEYYRGLIIYLLGALKFKNLDDAAGVSLPKQVAFWGAGALVELLHKPAVNVAKPRQVGVIRLPLLIVAMVEALIIVGMAMVIGGFGFDGWSSSVPSSIDEISKLGTPISKLIPLPQEEKPLAVIIGLSSGVSVNREEADELTGADLGLPLFQGDFLMTGSGASAYILCKNGLVLNVPEMRNVPVDCQRRVTITPLVDELDQSVVKQLFDPSDEVLEFISSTSLNRDTLEQKPLLLTPRNSLIDTSRPILQFELPDTGGKYHLRIITVSGEEWEDDDDISSKNLRYPPDAPSLELGDSNKIELLAEDGTTIEEITLTTLSNAEKGKLIDIEDKIRTSELDDVTQSFLLAELYREQQLWAKAIEKLKQLTQIQTPSSANLRQRLGDLYFEVELYLLAEENYKRAFEAADAPAARAVAQLGLARIALALGENQAAIEALESAESFYREAGLNDLAEIVAGQRAELEQPQ